MKKYVGASGISNPKPLANKLKYLALHGGDDDEGRGARGGCGDGGLVTPTIYRSSCALVR